MNYESTNKIEISQNSLEIKSSWGSVECVTKASAVVAYAKSNRTEVYQIEFRRDQVTGQVHRVDVTLPENTSEYTLTAEDMGEEILDVLRGENY